MKEINAINGVIQVGDLVISMPSDEYGCLIGTVTQIKPLGSDDRDTENETDDIYVDFSGSDYSNNRKKKIEEQFSERYSEHRAFEDLPLDMVIMAPDTLIKITEIKPDVLASLYDSEEITIAYCDHIISNIHNTKWTVCWKSEDHGNGWDRFPERDDVINFTNTLVREGDVKESDILIFPPTADSLIIPYGNIEDGIEDCIKNVPDDRVDEIAERCLCGNSIFIASQRCYHDIIVNSKNTFLSDIKIYESDKPCGPYTCKKCGKEYEDLNCLYTFIKVQFNHEDPEYCRTTFRTTDKGKKCSYFNREDGGSWYTVFPSNGYWESSSLVKKTVIFQIVDQKGNVLFEEGNGTPKTFTPISFYIKDRAKAYGEEHGLVSHEQWVEKLTSGPAYEEYINNRNYRDNWLYYEIEVIKKKILDSFIYLGYKYTIAEIKQRHRVSGVEFTAYKIQLKDVNCGICGYKFPSES